MKKKILLPAAAIAAGLAAVIYALMYTPPSPSSNGPKTPVSLAQLAERDGLDGRECWVAVDGTVYSISGFSEWQMGKHLPSKGKASCGRDLSGVIGESPHGKSILSLLRVVGELSDN